MVGEVEVPTTGFRQATPVNLPAQSKVVEENILAYPLSVGTLSAQGVIPQGDATRCLMRNWSRSLWVVDWGSFVAFSYRRVYNSPCAAPTR